MAWVLGQLRASDELTYGEWIRRRFGVTFPGLPLRFSARFATGMWTIRIDDTLQPREVLDYPNLLSNNTVAGLWSDTGAIVAVPPDVEKFSFDPEAHTINIWPQQPLGWFAVFQGGAAP